MPLSVPLLHSTIPITSSGNTNAALDYYLRKNFYKTASLMGHSCLAAAVLGEWRRATDSQNIQSCTFVSDFSLSVKHYKSQIVYLARD